MIKKPFFSTSKNQLTSLVFAIIIFFSIIQNSSAKVDDRVRNTTVGSDYSCNTKNLKFNPLDIVHGNDDINWELSNPTCIAYVASSGAAILAAVQLSSSLTTCKNVKGAARQAKANATGTPLFPQMVKDRIKEGASCTAYTIACAASGGSDASECSSASACCASALVTVNTVSVAIGVLGVIYAYAIDSQEHAHICGDKWNVWYKRDRRQNNPDDSVGIPDYPGDSNDVMYIFSKGGQDIIGVGGQTINVDSYQKQLENAYNDGTMERKVTNKQYREYIYGGVETEDNGDGACNNPSTWSDATRIAILGYTSDKQRYYMRGPKLTSNYACTRFLLSKPRNDADRQSAKDAYNCCVQRSQNTLCIEESGRHKFCQLGEKCKVKDVFYDIYGSQKVPNYICAETYSVCPYNHKLGGGTEIADYDQRYPYILNNHCQYLKHCAKIPNTPYIRTSNLDGAWISSACRDLKGDSQNNYGYTAQLVPINTKNFSAPIAQCFKETFENMFTNYAGSTQCNNPDEQPNAQGVCAIGGNKYTEGQVIAGEQSFFETIQDKLRFAIKMVMTIAITVLGVAVLLTGKPADKKTIIMFVIKLGLVAYFALGTGWQDGFFEGVSSTSMALSDIFMQVDEGQTVDRKDGCQFPKYNYAWVEGMPGTKYDNPSYPPGKSYLRIWDMLDCKIARALGFGPDASVPNLIYMALAGILSANLGFLGLVFFVGTFIFAFYLIALVVRALHIFLIASIAITLMVYVSPITITACLFKRTNGLFSGWWKQLLGFTLQPVMLFAYLGILITIFEGTVMGDATFSGDGVNAPKTINCSAGNAENNSIYCIFRIANIKTNNTLSPIGIGLPILINMNQEKVATIMKAAFIMFIFSKFMDAFAGSDGIVHKLVGGSRLASGSGGGMKALGQAFGMANAMRNRAAGAIRKHGGGMARRAGGYAKGVVGGIGRGIGARKDNNTSSGSSVANSAGRADATPASAENKGPTPPPRSRVTPTSSPGDSNG